MLFYFETRSQGEKELKEKEPGSIDHFYPYDAL